MGYMLPDPPSVMHPVGSPDAKIVICDDAVFGRTIGL